MRRVNLPGSESWNGKGELAPFLALKSSGLRQVHFPPSPTMGEGQTHLLGTSSKGYDVLAYLLGACRLTSKPPWSIPLVYALGISIGLLMGFFRGSLRLNRAEAHRDPFQHSLFFVVMIASTAIPEGQGNRRPLDLTEYFSSWLDGNSYLMRTAALKEKARDYIAADGSSELRPREFFPVTSSQTLWPSS